MKKSKLLVFSLASVLMLAGCGDNQPSSSSSEANSSTNTSEVVSSSEETNSSSSEEANSSSSESVSSSESSSEPVIETATIKKINNFVSDGTLNVSEGDNVEVESSITLTFAEPVTDKMYQIAVNKTIADMSWNEDNLSCFYTLDAAKDEELTISIIEKNPDSENGYKITFEQGEHYTVLGIVSGEKYEPVDGWDDEIEEWVSEYVYFAIIVDDGYILSKPILSSPEYGDSSLSPNEDGLYYIDYLTEDSTLIINVDKATEHTITYTGAENLDETQSNLPTTFMGGDTITFKFIGKAGYNVTAVSVDPYDYSYYYQNDYSNYTIKLPNEDVRITITTSVSYTISLASTEHLSNIGFYSSTSYSKNSEGKTALELSGEITTITNGTRFYVAFDVEDGYKVSEIVGNEVAGLAEGIENYYKATDGRYIFNCKMYGETSLKAITVTKKTVTLDSSVDSDKATLIFDNDVNSFFPGDDAKFNFLLTDTGNTRIGKVYICYTNEEGKAIEEEITYSNYYQCYSFVMPNADVTIKAEIIDIVKATLSYTNTAGDLVKSITITGATSGSKLSDSVATLETFEENESININITAGTNHSKKVKANLVTADATTEIALTLNVKTGKYSGSVSLPVGGATIQIVEGEDATVRTLTVPTGSSIEYYTSTDASSKVTSLGNLYDMDVFYFAVNDTPEEGYSLSVKVKINDEEVSSLTKTTIGGVAAYKVTVTGNVEIVVEQVKSVSLTISGAEYEGDGSDILFNYDTDDYLQVSNGSIAYGTRFYLEDYDYGREIETITIGGVSATADYSLDGFRGVYTATGDIVITLSEPY